MTKKKLRKGTEKYSRNLLSTRYQTEVRVPETRWGVQGTEVGKRKWKRKSRPGPGKGNPNEFYSKHGCHKI